MDFLLELRHLCERYPILFYVKIACSAFYVIPSLLLLMAVLKSSLHSNCRIMLSMWVVSQLCVYATVCWLSFQFILFEKKYFSDDFNPTTMAERKRILCWYGYSWFTCTCCELGISMERGISIRNPPKYYQSTPAYFIIISYFICSVTLSVLISELMLTGSLTVAAIVAGLMSNTLDISAFTTNFIVLFFSKRKYQKSEKQLNERYQVREAYSITRAMVPVYFLSSALKIAIIFVNWMYIIHAIPWSISEVVYIVCSEMSCGLTSSMFLYHNLRLRSKLAFLFNRRSIQIYSPSAKFRSQDTTESYFRMLVESWEKK